MTDGDQQWEEVQRAFTYGIPLNRTGADRKTWIQQYQDRFERRELNRRIKLLNERKASSVCGDRDTLMFTKANEKRNMLNSDTIEENQQDLWKAG